MSDNNDNNDTNTGKTIYYWFRSYQIDNTTGINTTIGNLRSLNLDIFRRFLYGDKAYDESIEDTDVATMIGEEAEYEIVTFKQSDNNGTLDPNQNSKCIYALILQKKQPTIATPENFKGMWMCVFCPKKACNGIACGSFGIWKVNLEGLPNTKLSWYATPRKPGDVAHKYCITTTFVDASGTTVGDKVVFGVVQKKLYVSPKSFYLEGRHEDILKKMPNINGMNVTLLQVNLPA